MGVRRFKLRDAAPRRWIRTHQGSVIASAFVVLIAALSAVWLDKEAWGALGQWAGAFGTVLAVVIALRIAQREADSQAARRRAEQVEHELQQARLIVVTINYPSPDDELHSKQTGQESYDLVKITNYGNTHVFYPRIEGFVHQNGGKVTWDVGTDETDDYIAPTVLSAGGEDRVAVTMTYNPPITPDMYPMRTKVVIGFTDANGGRWRHVSESTPERVRAADTFDIEGPDWYRAER